MNIDPHAWLLTVPLTIALVQIARRPADCIIRRCGRAMIEIETEMWFRLRRGMCDYNPAATLRTWRWVHAVAVGGFAIASVASFTAFVIAA